MHAPIDCRQGECGSGRLHRGVNGQGVASARRHSCFGAWGQYSRDGDWYGSRPGAGRPADRCPSHRRSSTSPRGQPTDTLPDPPPIPGHAAISNGTTPTYPEFVTCLKKCDRRWAECWVAWRETRPRPPDPDKRRTYDPNLIPGEARLFVEVYRLQQAYATWEHATRDRPSTEQPRGIRRSREQRAWEGRDDRQGRPRR